MKNYIKLLRPTQWLKNLFILLPLFFDFKITNVPLLYTSILAIFFFSLITSSVYIFNDYHDRDEDKKHPQKKTRPFASGKVSIKKAFILMAMLFVIGCVGSWLINPSMLYLVLLYSLINILYTLKLKLISLIDIVIIGIGFVIRLLIGAVVTGLTLSHWIITMIFLLALFISIAKRRDDMSIFVNEGNITRKVIAGYNMEFLNSAMVLSASAVIVFYIIYTVSPEIIMKVHTDKLYFTSIFVVLGILRYLQIAFVENNCGSPTYILIKDKFILFTILGWIVTFVALTY